MYRQLGDTGINGSRPDSLEVLSSMVRVPTAWKYCHQWFAFRQLGGTVINGSRPDSLEVLSSMVRVPTAWGYCHQLGLVFLIIAAVKNV